MRNVSKWKFSTESVEKQTRFLTLLAKVIRVWAVLTFAIAVIMGVKILFDSHSIRVDEYGNPMESPLVAALMLLAAGMGSGAFSFIVAALLDSLRGLAVNSAKVANMAPASA
jgi:hypothetical protein